MAQFEYEIILNKLLVPEVVKALGAVKELKGEASWLSSSSPDTFTELLEIARIQSIGASNRIENISTSDERLRKLVLHNTKPLNRDETEIAGYRYVLDEIHECNTNIPVTAPVILQLHRDLYRFTAEAHAGKWKDSDNIIAEQTTGEELRIRFVPTSAIATPYAVEKICSEWSSHMRANIYDPLLVSLVFIFDFVSIHPFTDGNGRMSRLLTLLLLYYCGYDIGKYISIEQEIEQSKETYYEALAASSIAWQEGQNDYVPFVTYMLGIICACYKKLNSRFVLVAQLESNETQIRKYFDQLVGSATKRQILDANPQMSQRTLERILAKLQKQGLIQKVGAARSTSYRSTP